MPTRMPLVKGIFSSPAASIVCIRMAGCLVGEPACTVSMSRSATDSRISPCEAVTGRRTLQVGAVQHAEVGVRQQPALERLLADPDDVGGEVRKAQLGALPRDPRLVLGPLPG